MAAGMSQPRPLVPPAERALIESVMHLEFYRYVRILAGSQIRRTVAAANGETSLMSPFFSLPLLHWVHCR